MVDIAAERAWMLQRADRQLRENEQRHRREWEQERVERLATCPFCFHASHHDHFGGATIDIEAGSIDYDCKTADDWMLSLRVKRCSMPACPCGEPPCEQCGDRVPADYIEQTGTMRCPMCGFELEPEWTA